MDTLAALVVLRDERAIIGTGVWREIGDCIYAGVPVLVFDDHVQNLHELRGLLVIGPDARGPARAAWTMLGDRVDLGRILDEHGTEYASMDAHSARIA